MLLYHMIDFYLFSLPANSSHSVRDIEAVTLGDVTADVRLNNYIPKLDADLEQIESFIKNTAGSPEPQKLQAMDNILRHIAQQAEWRFRLTKQQ